MSSSVEPEVVLGASLLGSVLREPEEYEELVREEVEHRLHELARKLVKRLEESYGLLPPRDGWEAVRRAEEVIEKVIRGEEAQSIKQLLEHIDVESYVREQVRLFAARVDELYEDVYKHYAGRQGLTEIEPVLMTLTAVKILYLSCLEDPRLMHAPRDAVALLAALAVLAKQRRLDVIKQLPKVAEEVLAKHLSRLQKLEGASQML